MKLLRLLLNPMLTAALAAACSQVAASPAAATAAITATSALSTPSLPSLPATVSPFPPTPIPTALPPLPESIRNAAFRLSVGERQVTLKDGEYESTSGNERLLVRLADVFASGDLIPGDPPETAVILAENTGGSGIFESLVVVSEKGGRVVQLGNVLLGDRVQVRSLAIQAGRIRLEMVRQGPNDPLCCPTLPVTHTYRLNKTGLVLARQASQTPAGAERSITITAPAAGEQVGAAVQVSGNVTIAPFENTLIYTLYDARGNQLSVGPVVVNAAKTGGPGNFTAAVDLKKVNPGVIVLLEIADISMADGSILAMDSVELVRK